MLIISVEANSLPVCREPRQPYRNSKIIMSEWAVSYSIHSAAQSTVHTEAYLHGGNTEEMDA